MASWEDSVKVGAAVNEIADRIMEGGYTRSDLARWLTWIALVGAHPERYDQHLKPRPSTPTRKED